MPSSFCIVLIEASYLNHSKNAKCAFLCSCSFRFPSWSSQWFIRQACGALNSICENELSLYLLLELLSRGSSLMEWSFLLSWLITTGTNFWCTIRIALGTWLSVSIPLELSCGLPVLFLTHLRIFLPFLSSVVLNSTFCNLDVVGPGASRCSPFFSNLLAQLSEFRYFRIENLQKLVYRGHVLVLLNMHASSLWWLIWQWKKPPC